MLNPGVGSQLNPLHMPPSCHRAQGKVSDSSFLISGLLGQGVPNGITGAKEVAEASEGTGYTLGTGEVCGEPERTRSVKSCSLALAGGCQLETWTQCLQTNIPREARDRDLYVKFLNSTHQ